MFKKIAKFLLVAVVIMAIIGGCSNTTKTGESGNSGESGTKQEEKKTEDLTLVGEIEDSIEYDMPKFVGEIKNNTDNELSYVQIEIFLYDKDNAQVGTALANTTKLKAGGTWKFETSSIDSGAENYDHYEYEISGH